MGYDKMQEKMINNYEKYASTVYKISKTSVIGFCYMMVAMPVAFTLLHESLNASKKPEKEKTDE